MKTKLKCILETFCKLAEDMAMWDKLGNQSYYDAKKMLSEKESFDLRICHYDAKKMLSEKENFDLRNCLCKIVPMKRGTIIKAIRYWMKNQRPTLKKAKSLNMTKEEYKREYHELVEEKIKGMQNEVPDVFSEEYYAELKECIEILKKELETKDYFLSRGF